jgi:hypothetical protein
MAKPRDAKPGELREIKTLELLEKFSRRPESRIDVQKILSNLTPTGQIYAKHLVMSGPSSLLGAARELGLTVEEIEAALTELETGIAKLTSKPKT